MADPVPALVTLTLSPEERTRLHDYLLGVVRGADPKIGAMAMRCQQAVNARAVVLGRATGPEPIDFLPDEIEWLRARIADGLAAMTTLSGIIAAPPAVDAPQSPA